MWPRSVGSTHDYRSTPPSCSTESNSDLKHEIGCMVIQYSGTPNNSDAIRRFIDNSSRKRDPSISEKHKKNRTSRPPVDSGQVEPLGKRNLQRITGRRSGRYENQEVRRGLSRLSINESPEQRQVNVPPANPEHDVNSRDFRPISRLRRFHHKTAIDHNPVTKSNRDLKIEPPARGVGNRYDVTKQQAYCESSKHDVRALAAERLQKLSSRKNEKRPELPPKDMALHPFHHPDSKAQRQLLPGDKIQQSNCFADQRKTFHSIEKDRHRGRGRYQRMEPTEPIVKPTASVPQSQKTFSDLYQVQDMIGVGGCGVVYAGIRTDDLLPVAIKHVPREKVKRWEKIKRHEVPQEIALMMRVSKHRGVIKLLDWFEGSNFYTMVMERPRNCIDLFDYIQERRRLKEKEASKIFKQDNDGDVVLKASCYPNMLSEILYCPMVLSALHYIHSRGVVHRDIKDENIILNQETAEVKIIDFGCGTLLHEGHYKDFAGTPEFYPPEWFNEHRYQAGTAAVWSLGVLLYGMVCGEIPFKTKDLIAQGKFEFKVHLSTEIKKLISWMLRKRPEERPTLGDISEHPWLCSRK